MRQTVFVVENDPEVRAALGELLEDEGMRPVLFREADEAVSSLADERPSLCVVDGIGGAEMFLAGDGERPADVPVVVFTSWKVAGRARDRLVVVDKPDVAGLLASIETLARRRLPAPLKVLDLIR